MMCLFGSAQPFLLLTFLDFCAAIYSNAANSSESLSVASSTSTGNVSHPDYSPTSHLSIFATDPTDNTSNSSQTSFTIASLSDSDVATHSLALPSTPISQPNTRLNDHTITSSPSISSSFTTYGWGNQTSNQTDTPRSAPPLSTYVWGNQTYTQCPIEDADFGYTARDAQCCSYYNSDLSTAVFESWVTAGAAEPSPDVGARYGCCGDCTILVSNIQVLYWPDATAQEWITCSTSYTTYATSLPAGVRCPACATSWDVTEPLYSTADAAYGCNHPAPSPFFTEIGGYTLTSPTPYIRFTSFWPYDWCGKVIGLTGYDNFITAAPSQLFTLASDGMVTTVDYLGHQTVQTKWIDAPLNFADYGACYPDCHPIIPIDVWEHFGAGQYAGCKNLVAGYYDPPFALIRETGYGNGVSQSTKRPVAGTAKPAQKPTPPASPTQAGSGQTGQQESGKHFTGSHVPSATAQPPPNPAESSQTPASAQPQNNPMNTPPTIQASSQATPAQGPPGPPVPSPSEQDPSSANGGPIIHIGSMTYSPNSVSQYEIGSQTLVAGGPAITVSGAIVSLAPSASALVIGSNTQALSPSPVTSIPQAPGITLSPNLVLSTDPAATYYYIIGSQTLVPGGPPLTLSGTRVSLAASASALIIGSMTSILPIAAGSDPFPLLTIDSHTLTASSAGHTYAIGSQSLIPGGPAIVVSGMTLSLDPAGTALIVDGTSTQALASTIPSSMVIGSHTLIANAAGQYIFGIQTLVPGGPGITIDGTVISILASATTSMATTSTTTEAGALDDVGLAMLILKGLGGTASPTKSPHTETSSSTMSIQSPRVGNNGNSSTTESSGKPSGASLSRPGVSLTLGAAILSFIVVLM